MGERRFRQPLQATIGKSVTSGSGSAIATLVGGVGFSSGVCIGPKLGSVKRIGRLKTRRLTQQCS